MPLPELTETEIALASTGQTYTELCDQLGVHDSGRRQLADLLDNDPPPLKFKELPMNYTLYVWYTTNDSYRHESFTHPDAFVSKFQVKGEVEEREKTDLYVDFRSQYVYFHPEGAECVGECHLDARCTGSYRHYVPVALAEEGLKRFEGVRIGQNKRADDYYSQPWV